MSTTRPLASEMTGISRAMSGNTEPVTFNSAGASRCSTWTKGNWSGLSTLTRLISPVCTTSGEGGAPSAGLNSFLHATDETQAAKQQENSRIDLVVIEHLVPYGKIHLAGCCHVC